MKELASLAVDVFLAAAFAFIAFGVMVLLFCVGLKIIVEIFQ